jgi:hypothetical protein
MDHGTHLTGPQALAKTMTLIEVDESAAEAWLAEHLSEHQLRQLILFMGAALIRHGDAAMERSRSSEDEI